MSFRRKTKSHRSLLSGVYARGSKISHTWDKCVTCRGLKNSEINQSCVSPRIGCLESTYSRLFAGVAVIDDFRGACAVKGNGAVAGHVKRVDHDDVFDALLFREETLTRHYFNIKIQFFMGHQDQHGQN